MKIGTYVFYKNTPYIIVGIFMGGKALLIHPCIVTEEGVLTDTGKLKVAATNKDLRPVKCAPAKVVQYKDTNYIVTAKHNIFSLKTGKIMKWGNGNGVRKAILKIAA